MLKILVYNSLYLCAVGFCLLSILFAPILIFIDRFEAVYFAQPIFIKNKYIIKKLKFLLNLNYLFWKNYLNFFCTSECPKNKQKWFLLLYFIAMDGNALRKTDWDVHKVQKDLLDNALRRYANNDHLPKYYPHN